MRHFLTKFLLLALLIASSISVYASYPPIGPSVTDSILTFESEVYLPEDKDLSEKNMAQAVYDQVKHLLSQFESPEFTNYNGEKLILGQGLIGLGPIESYKVLEKTSSATGSRNKIRYSVKVRVLSNKKFLKVGETKEIKFFVPMFPDKVYIKARTDDHYPETRYFYYFWRPPFDVKDLPLFRGDDSVQILSGKLTGIDPDDEKRSPDYERLYKQAQKDGELRIALLLGFDDKANDPHDLARKSYRYLVKYFAKKGFIVDELGKQLMGPFVEFVKPATRNYPAVRLSLSLSASDIDYPVQFAKRARHAFENAHVIMYDGHSGVGGNLNIEMLEQLSSSNINYPTPIVFSRNYQIYYINSCVSYFFYSQMYAKAKNGLRNTDVITNGLSADFRTQNPETIAFLNQFIDGEQPARNWVDLLAEVEKAQRCSYLLNVLSLPD